MKNTFPGFIGLARLFDLFEGGAMLILSLCITIVACLGLLHVVVAVVKLVLHAGLQPTDPAILQEVFGLFFTVLIALEFRHSILVLPSSESQGMIRMRSVLLIGMMAAVRKFIVLDLNGVNVRELLALSAAVLSLSAAYWLVRGKAMARVDATIPPPSQTSQDTQPQKN
ncbi:hypothetical protein GM556_06150 [Bombella sp. ESL0378]|uniref:phosphate-starvation-inducible PsiE family protein n=1 Tax=Bombella sp. ESL0378 TaxID=2676442 RepID=UPI0012D8ED68|nr:phosphate-starvation-inducible PsiE family protein [Bombella sp. ESL0378]MUG05123.1 hypothetical protein [Bombella sp. ESL0378]